MCNCNTDTLKAINCMQKINSCIATCTDQAPNPGLTISAIHIHQRSKPFLCFV